MENQEVSNWVFNLCPVTNSWRAVKREHYNDICNSFGSSNVIKSKDINVLIELINKTNGNIPEMNKLMKNEA